MSNKIEEWFFWTALIFPFASKITNSFSLIFSIFSALIAAAIQGWKKYDFPEKILYLQDLFLSYC